LIISGVKNRSNLSEAVLALAASFDSFCPVIIKEKQI
jgi:hypothetical protein